MNETASWSEHFISRLLRLHQQDSSDARAALADLRRGLRDRLHGPYDIGRVGRHLGDHWPPTEEALEWMTAVGAVYALVHDRVPQTAGQSLGRAFRQLRDSPNGSDSTDARFMALLNSHPENLPGHLRQVISLIASAQIGIGFDWYRLLREVQQWDSQGFNIQKSWARDYYRNQTPSTVSKGQTVTQPSQQKENSHED